MGKEDRLKRRIKKKEDKIKILTPKAGNNNKPKGRAVTPTFSVVNTSAVKGNTGRTKVDGCGSAAQQRGSKNCSKSATGKKFSTKGTTKTVGSLKKRKKLQEDIDNLKGKLSKSKKGSPTKKHANPRYL